MPRVQVLETEQSINVRAIAFGDTRNNPTLNQKVRAYLVPDIQRDFAVTSASQITLTPGSHQRRDHRG